MGKIVKVLVEGEEVSLKQTTHFGKFTEWRVIFPLKKDETKGYGWENLHKKNAFIGSFDTLYKTFFIILLILFLSYAYARDVKVLTEKISDPCGVCYNVTLNQNQVAQTKPINVSIIESVIVKE